MQNFFDAVNAYLLHHPDLLAYLHFLFRLKAGCLLLIMGVFLFLVYREDWRDWRTAKQRADCRLAA
ncbi:hypothetical protein [Methylogaea oryzae]|uniref:Uncharacterized protein n=2 Tax=Methylogaea oryzae TaxID=1295382 RepID=A0A8D4VPR0_9GAMM|nr:hypothetical protein [Methylogaea oryzae]BBL71511.1 hypothetical protein MoryE10_21170 [Methylogaea oryzae]